jgi:beta-lactam-binding protein with PASTA domain
MPTTKLKILRFLSLLKKITLRTLGGLAMFLIFIVSAFFAMRLAIHGREVSVPTLAGLSDTDAADVLKKLGLHLSVEDRFYATGVPVNHVLSQSPLPGTRVRRGWQIRVTESLGTQQVPVPDVTGQDVQPATFMIKRLQLEVGTVAHIPGPSPTGSVLAQSPPPNVAGLDGPRVALLVADDQTAPASQGYVMPAIVGLTVAAANARLGTVGLHISAPTPPPVEIPEATTPTGAPPDPAIPPTIVPAAPVFSASSIITSQSPLPGRRVSRADTIHVTTTPAPDDTNPSPAPPTQ